MKENDQLATAIVNERRMLMEKTLLEAFRELSEEQKKHTIDYAEKISATPANC